MRVIVNGKECSFEAPLNLYDILEQEEVIGMLVAVARNGAFVSRAHYASTAVEEGDRIEIVAPMQGG